MPTRLRLRDTDGCNIREALFARHFVRLKGDSARAARAAGYHGDLRVRACALLRRPHVGSAIRRLTAETLSKLDLQASDVIAEVSRIAFADVRRLFDDEGQPLNIHDVDEDTARAVSSITQDDGKIVITFWSKIKALAMLSMWLRHNASPESKATSLVKVNFLNSGENEMEMKK
jgi:hypothetical protein